MSNPNDERKPRTPEELGKLIDELRITAAETESKYAAERLTDAADELHLAMAERLNGEQLRAALAAFVDSHFIQASCAISYKGCSHQSLLEKGREALALTPAGALKARPLEVAEKEFCAGCQAATHALGRMIQEDRMDEGLSFEKLWQEHRAQVAKEAR